ncbi:MAG: LamG domain-containing protein [Cognaticolwellia sp.]
MKYLVLLVVCLLSLSASAFEDIVYDYNTRSPGSDIYAFRGESSIQVPNNLNFPNSSVDYAKLQFDDDSYLASIATSTNNFPSMHYIIFIDQDETDVTELNILWNGYGINNSSNKRDGVVLYIWNFRQDSYEELAFTTSANEVNLTSVLTSNITDYLGGSNENAIVLYAVSVDSKSSENSVSNIYADYVSLRVSVPTPATLTANFQFDECAYVGNGNEVIDQLGNYSGTSHNDVNTSSDAQIAKALTISNAQHHVRTSIPVTADFSVSTWFKKPNDDTGSRYFALGAMSGGGDLFLLDRDNDLRWAVYNPSQGNVNGTYSFANLDSAWHHMALVYSGNETSLYIDGNFIETISIVPSGTLAFIGTSFDDVDSANPQGFRAPIDEFLVFNGSLTPSEVSSIYNNQLSGKNYDGATRQATYCVATPVANFKFDEVEYTDVAGEVKDSIGSFHGRAKFAQPVEGKVCQALDLSATGTADYVVLDEDVLNGKSEFSISVWAKTAKTGAQSFLSGATSGSNNELIMWFTRDTSFRPHLQNTNNGTLTVSSIAGDTWRHLVWTHGNNKSCLFIDKVAQGCIDQPTNVLEISSLIVGQEQDSVGGSFDAGQSYNGLLDELVIYDQVIDQSQIDQIYDYQNNGLGLDGEPVSCIVNPILHYSMDETSWNGSAGEVFDETGNFNTQAINGLTTGNSTRALTGNPGTCGYGNFDGVDDYIQLNDDPRLDLQNALTISAWINPEALPASGLKTIVSKDENYEFHLTPAGEINWWWQTQSFSTSGAGITAGNWHHVAITYESGKQVIYVNGVDKGSRTFTGDLILNNDPLQIGQDQGLSERFFSGFIDEVFIFARALSTLEINEIYNKRHACVEPAIHHYEIVHDGNGLTCASEPITIKACTNSSCSTNSDLSTESVSLDFVVTSTIDGSMIKASPTFTGSTSFNFNHFNAESLVLSIDGATVLASNPVECSGFGTSCNMTFADAGFRFLYSDSNSPISHQTAGKEFEEELKLQAVKSNNGVCEGIFTGDVNISLAQENVSPDLNFNAGLAFESNGNTIAKYPLFTDNVTLDFGSDSIAIIPKPIYLDAGEIRLHAKYSNSDISIVGSSNDFWVKPARFEIVAKKTEGNANDYLNGDNAEHVTIHKAGENFSFTINALNYLGAITQNYRQSDGILELKVSRIAPQGDAVDGTFTYAAGQNRSTSTSAIFEKATVTNFSDGNKGSSVFNGAQYGEVGIINLDVQDSNYGGLGESNGLVSAADITVGRFTPAYFKQTVKDDHKGKLDAFQSAIGQCGISEWTYTGQRTNDDEGTIRYSLEPKITITAFNALGLITKNYTLGEPEKFLKLEASGVDITLPTHDETQQIVGSVTDNPVAITGVMKEGSFKESLDDDGNAIAGEWLYTYSDEDHFSYDRDDTSFLKPFDAMIPFVTEQITDSDGITLQSDPSTSLVLDSAIEKFVVEGVQIRFARMVLENSYGAETAELRAPLNIQVYDGTNFNIHSDENCLTATIGDKQAGAKYSGNMNLWDYRLIDIEADAIQVGDTEASIPAIAGIDNALESGIQNQVFFSAPEKQGALEWEYEVPSWLKFKWDALDSGNDGNFYDDNPIAVLNFGRFRGNDRIISWREVVN